MPCGEEAFAEVAGDDLFLIADGCEIYARVPALQYIDIRRYIVQLTCGKDTSPEKWLE